MFNVERVTARIRQDEGFSSARYLCPAGIWTVGYGTTRLRGAPVTADTPPIGLEEARLHLKANILDAIADCQAVYGSTFYHLHDVHQEILICLAYQLGRRGLKGFVHMNAAIERFDYAEWIAELRDSQMFRRYTTRITRYLEAIQSGQWPA